jgi:hypothetical protein
MATVYYNSQASGSADGTSEADAYEDLQTALNALSAGDHLYCKRHTSREGVKTTNLTFTTNSNTNAGNTVVEGYATTPGDGGMYQTFSPVYFNAEGVELRYFDVDADGDGTPAISIRGDGSVAYRCKAVNSYAFGNSMEIIDSAAVECFVRGKVTQTGDEVFSCNRGTMVNCVVIIDAASGSAGSAIVSATGFRQNQIINCLIINEDGAESHVGISFTGGSQGAATVINNTIYNMDVGIEFTEGPATVRVSTPSTIYGNLIYSVGTGIKNSKGTNNVTYSLLAYQNAFGAVTTAQTADLAVSLDDITLTENPFIDTTNYQLNNAPGGGALVKGVLGIPDPKDPSPITSLVRTDFQSSGGVAPIPVKEITRSF